MSCHAPSQLGFPISLISNFACSSTMPSRAKPIVLASVEKNVIDVDDDEDADDEIVREIDVYLSPELASQLYLLQYPLEHGTAYVLPTEARMKPQHNMLELSEPFPQNAELQGEYCHLESRIFTSQTIPVTTHLCVGKLKESENGTALHLVPLSHIAQMRPSFGHLEVQDAVDPLYETDDDGMQSEEDNKAAAAKQQNKPIIFQRKETERAANARRSSYAFMKTSEESEPWVDLNVRAKGSLEYRNVMSNVYCSAINNNVILHDDLSEAAYIESLNYIPKDGIETLTDPATETETDLKSIVIQLTTIMLAGCPIPYSILQSQISARVSNQDLFTALSVCAILVKGNFCIQSKLMNLPKPMQRARTFILMLLNKGTIERARLDRAFDGKVSSQRLLSLLQQTGRLTADGWTLKVEEDVSFRAQYPAQAKASKVAMDKLEAKFKLELKQYNSSNL
ncbi:hypothetical protein MPSEU_000298100 [Mayamaea pseudoterrestris]|nr:hypothetical protein MPSEU_000298100 [Mayamaea pseudoterrestris]